MRSPSPEADLSAPGGVPASRPPVRSPLARRLVDSLAALAAAVPLARPGTTTPGGAAPYLSAPITGRGARRSKPARLRRTLRLSAAEGMFAEVITACAGGAVLTGWALHLGCSPLLIGLIASLPQMAQLAQLPAAWTTSLLGHRRACLWMVGVSRQALLPMIALPFLPIPDAAKQVLLVCVAALSAVLGVLGNNAWVAWMGELVPRKVRGRYFGKRTALCLLSGALASAGAGALLDGLRPLGHIDLALSILAACACGAGAVTTSLLLRHHDPSRGEPSSTFDLQSALAPLRTPGTRHLMAYQATWNFAVGIAGSYFALFMLRDLGMGFTLMAVHGTATAIVRMVCAPLWGKAIDTVGARPVLITSSFAISIIPLLWLLPERGALWPLALDVVLSGVLWGGQSLAIFALPLSVTPRKGRPYHLAAVAMVAGLAFSAATAVGGLVVQSLPSTFVLGDRTWSSLQVLFVLSSAARLLAAGWGLRVTEPGSQRVSALLRLLPALVAPTRKGDRLLSPAEK